MKRVEESSAASSISAYIILNKENIYVAKVQMLHSKSGSVQVDVLTIGEGITFQNKVGGYGYDKVSAALKGAVIDGNTIYDNCGQDEESRNLLEQYKAHDISIRKDWEKSFNNLGMHFANWNSEKQMYSSLHYTAGLDRLRELGYKVIQAI